MAETLDWVEALVALDRRTFDPETVDATLGVLLKYQDDVELARGAVVERVLEKIEEPAGEAG